MLLFSLFNIVPSWPCGLPFPPHAAPSCPVLDKAWNANSTRSRQRTTFGSHTSTLFALCSHRLQDGKASLRNQVLHVYVFSRAVSRRSFPAEEPFLHICAQLFSYFCAISASPFSLFFRSPCIQERVSVVPGSSDRFHPLLYGSDPLILVTLRIGTEAIALGVQAVLVVLTSIRYAFRFD